MQMAKISDATKEQLRSFLPAAASVKNPVDMIASAPIEHYTQTLETVIKDESVDMIMVIYLPFLGLKDIDVAKALMEIKAKNPEKPIVGVFMTTSSFFTEISNMDVNMPFYMYAEEAAEALCRLDEQRQWMAKPEGKIPCFDVDRAKVEKIIANSLKEGRAQLTTLESIDVLQAYGIRACKYGLATNEEEVVTLGNSIGYPVVMKMTSKTTSHKTDPMMMFGLGGVFVEVMKDVTFRIAPLTDVDADEMIKSVKAYKLLEGARGTKPAQIDQIQETLLRLSQLVSDFKFIDELDINPLLISEATGEGIAVDGRIKVRLEEAKEALGCTCSECSCCH